MTDLYRCDLDPRTGRDRFTRATEDEIMAQDFVVAALETAAERIAALEEEGDRLGLMAAAAMARQIKAESERDRLRKHNRTLSAIIHRYRRQTGDEPERCEGCGKPATTCDSECVPLCGECADALAMEAADRAADSPERKE